ncbi:ATP-grasp domain-containing protein [Streptomyces sp. HNM0575]|uniref:ATP-grasp domain-containing protein n=1 Tax=Streptomyces sp. HNM0575 TaxID=2716338 RepID=UPI00145F1B0D|nr:ATP-grasp domain-containing protein [Streptomyces sp. HNM0575]NLU73860.1 ATP-grasp domain-containing protein [Streptomyces sp. HNM0575]
MSPTQESRQENVFVLGLDERNRELLHDLPHLSAYRFHGLLGLDELQSVDTLTLGELLRRAERQLDAFDGPVDAIVGYWDFPVSSMVPILCNRYGLPSASLESVVKCEHKYWSRLEQEKVCGAHPGFALVDLQNPQQPPGVSFPMWLKPVKSRSSELAFRVEDSEQLADAAARIRDGLTGLGEAFDEALAFLDLPPEIAEAGGQACLAEEEASGRELTVEGYCLDGTVHIYGVIDSVLYPGTSSFLRYQYPSSVPSEVAERLAGISRRVVLQIGLDNSTFNIEFFWDPDRDRLDIVEVNPRLSQSHAPLFEYVDGVPNHQCMISLALGRDPGLPYREGPYQVAGKWFLRRFSDAYVRHVPDPDDIARVEKEVPGTITDVVAEEGRRLSELPMQDSYSYELAAMYIGAEDEKRLEEKYQQCVELLPFGLDDEERE